MAWPSIAVTTLADYADDPIGFIARNGAPRNARAAAYGDAYHARLGTGRRRPSSGRRRTLHPWLIFFAGGALLYWRLPIDEALLWGALLAVALFLVVRVHRWWTAPSKPRPSSDPPGARLCRRFGLDPAIYNVIGADIGGLCRVHWLEGDGLRGKPDAVFKHKDSGAVIVGEAKSRRYRGALKPYEENQMQLYLGLARRQFGRRVRGLVRYRGGKLVEVQPNRARYREVVNLIPELRRVMGLRKTPDYHVYSISERSGTADRWTQVGVGWTNKDDSINIVVDEPPPGPLRLNIREP